MDEAIQEAEAAGFFWAIERSPDGTYTAVAERTSNYIGDALSGPGAITSTTPAEALRAAVAQELKYEAGKSARS